MTSECASVYAGIFVRGKGDADHHCVRSARALTVRWLLEVDVRVAQRAARNHVAADADGEHRAGRAELLIQHGLGHV